MHTIINITFAFHEQQSHVTPFPDLYRQLLSTPSTLVGTCIILSADTHIYPRDVPSPMSPTPQRCNADNTTHLPKDEKLQDYLQLKPNIQPPYTTKRRARVPNLPVTICNDKSFVLCFINRNINTLHL